MKKHLNLKMIKPFFIVLGYILSCAESEPVNTEDTSETSATPTQTTGSNGMTPTSGSSGKEISTVKTSTSTDTSTTSTVNHCDPSTGKLVRGSTKIELGKTYNNPFFSLAVDPNNAFRVFVGSESNGIFRSDDGGVTWIWLRSGLRCTLEGSSYNYPEVYDIAVDPKDGNRVFAATTGGPGTTLGKVAGLYSSTNGGASWKQHFFEGLGGDGFVTVAIHPTIENRMIIGMASGVSTRSDIAGTFFPGYLVASKDAGATLTGMVAQTPTNASGCGFNDAMFRGTTRGYVSCAVKLPGEAGAFLQSTDGGLVWSTVSLLDITRFSAGYSNNDLVYAARRSSTILQRSIDGGLTFSNVEVPFEGSTKPMYYAGGPIAVSPSTDSKVFLGNSDQLLRTTDGFATIPKVVLTVSDDALDGSLNIIQDIVISPSDPNIVYVSARNLRIYRSTDGGSTFGSAIKLIDFIATQE